MITEDYVSFTTAKLLKEKGFDGKDAEDCFAFYNENGEIGFLQTFGDIADYDNSENPVIAPTHQMAVKWLRGKGIYITIGYGDYPTLNKVFWIPQIDSLKGFDLPTVFYKEYDEYEQAVEAALKYCLKNLIK